MAKLSSTQIVVDGNNFGFYDYREELSENFQSVSITLNKESRMAVNPLCEKAGYNNGTAGNSDCGIYIGVQCHVNDQVCAYKLNLKVYEDDQIVFSDMPRYITWD